MSFKSPVRPSQAPQAQQKQQVPMSSSSSSHPNTIIPKTSKIPSVKEEKEVVNMDGPDGVDDLLRSLTKGTNAELSEMQLSDVDVNGTLSDLGSNIRSVTYQNKRTTRADTGKKRLDLNLNGVSKPKK